MRTSYWSCSNFADWLRGTPKPGAETNEGWRDWRKAAVASHRIRYWLAEEGLTYLQNFVMWPADKLNDLRYYINNRYVTRSNSLTAHPRDIAPGSWCDVGNRFLPCLFNELVDFIEIEKAWMMCVWGQEDNKIKYKMPWWRERWWARWGRVWRCRDAGLDHLAWEIALKDDNDKPTWQAVNAKEQLDLYTWWTLLRPARPDPADVSGWTAISNHRFAEKDNDDILGRDDKTDDERAATRNALDRMTELEAKYAKEDEDMMIRLIKIRDSLWT